MLAGNLVNDGRRTARITSIQAPQWLEVKLDQRTSAADEDDIRGVRGFRPFTLPPDGRRSPSWPACLLLEERRAARPSPASPFRFEVLGLEREAWLRVGGADGEPLVYSAPSPPRRPRLAPEAQG